MQKEINKHERYTAIENFIANHKACEIKNHYECASNKEEWVMAIKTNMACGKRKDLEEVFHWQWLFEFNEVDIHVE